MFFKLSKLNIDRESEDILHSDHSNFIFQLTLTDMLFFRRQQMFCQSYTSK